MLFVGCTDGHTKNCFRMLNLVTSRVCESQDIIWCGQMYFTSENSDKTKLQPVIGVTITNDVSNAYLTVTEVIKVVLPNSLGKEGMGAVTETSDSPSKEVWMTATTKKGRQSIRLGHYDPARKTFSWSVTGNRCTSGQQDRLLWHVQCCGLK